jgi:hypothetical protein
MNRAQAKGQLLAACHGDVQAASERWLTAGLDAEVDVTEAQMSAVLQAHPFYPPATAAAMRQMAVPLVPTGGLSLD